MSNSEAIAKLQAAVLASQTLGELYALMEDYSYAEFMQVYNQLTPLQQAELDAICDRDTQTQMAALNGSRQESSVLVRPGGMPPADLGHRAYGIGHSHAPCPTHTDDI